MWNEPRTYAALNPDEKKQADRIVAPLYDLLDLWDTVIKVKLEPEEMMFHGSGVIVMVEWRLYIRYQDREGGISLSIYPKNLTQEGYRRSLFMGLLVDLGRMIWEKQASQNDSHD